MATHSTTKPSLSERWEDYQPSKTMLVWACIASTVATMVVGFAWGGWVTGGTSQSTAKAAGDTARGELASAICIERFNAATDSATKLAEFRALPDRFKKRQFIESGGWATMPGHTSPDRLGAEACSTALSA